MSLFTIAGATRGTGQGEEVGSKAGRLCGPAFVSATGSWHRLWQGPLAASRSAHLGDSEAAPP